MFSLPNIEMKEFISALCYRLCCAQNHAHSFFLFLGGFCNCSRINCWRGCRSDLKTDRFIDKSLLRRSLASQPSTSRDFKSSCLYFAVLLVPICSQLLCHINANISEDLLLSANIIIRCLGLLLLYAGGRGGVTSP